MGISIGWIKAAEKKRRVFRGVHAGRRALTTG